jgi:hypothetical protein
MGESYSSEVLGITRVEAFLNDVQGHIERSDWNIGLCEARISVVKEKQIDEEKKANLLKGYEDALEEMQIGKEKWINHISQK